MAEEEKRFVHQEKESFREKKGLKVNVNKTKAFVTGESDHYLVISRVVTTVAAKDPCSIFGKRMRSNSIQCRKWMHKNSN